MVEDDPQDAELALAAWKSLNFDTEVQVVTDGSRALDYLRRQGEFRDLPDLLPTLILLDLKMPKVNGLEVLRFIKTSDTLRMIPVVVLSSSKELRDLEECYRIGANAYVVKPMDYADFLRAMKQIGQFWMSVNEPPPHRPESGSAPSAVLVREGSRDVS